MKDQLYTPEEPATEQGFDLPQFVKRINEIGDLSGIKGLTAPVISHSKRLSAATRDVMLCGFMEIRLVNELVGNELIPPSILPFPVDLVICDGGKGSEPYYLVNEEKRLPALFTADLPLLALRQPVFLFTDNPWLRSQNVRLHTKRLSEQIVDEESRLFDFFRNADLVVFFIDSLMPLSKNEAFYTRKCIEKRVPCLITPARITSLNDEEQVNVSDYIKSFVRKNLPNAAWLEPVGHDQQSLLHGLFPALGQNLGGPDLLDRRLEFFVDDAINSLLAIRNVLIRQIDEHDTLLEQLREATAAEKQLIEKQSDEWILIENNLIEGRQKLEQLLRGHLSKSRDKILDTLLVELDRSADPKGCWERDLPFTLNRELQGRAEKLSCILMQEIKEILEWLKQTTISTFDFEYQGNESVIQIDELPVKQHQLHLLDTQKTRLRARYGTAAVVVVAGTLFVFTGVGGIAIATSMLFGAGVEQYITDRGKKEKEIIKNELYTIIGNSEAVYVNEFSQKVKRAFDKIILSLKMNQTRWLLEKNRLVDLQETNKIKEAAGGHLQEALQAVNGLLAEIL
jgi:hypothetical protein